MGDVWTDVSKGGMNQNVIFKDPDTPDTVYLTVMCSSSGGASEWATACHKGVGNYCDGTRLHI